MALLWKTNIPGVTKYINYNFLSELIFTSISCQCSEGQKEFVLAKYTEQINR